VCQDKERAPYFYYTDFFIFTKNNKTIQFYIVKNKLIIHGHFYQPPREDPWIGLVPSQTTAYPYHDWNERITRECYAANSMSRTLNAFGQITDIVNNYSFISFNFGPTLLNWLKMNTNYVYENIIEADRISLVKNNGHGNAIAQAYNHTILPLCSPEDAKTQVIWGIKDFEVHFGRKSEGIWLPEAAVNMSVVDLLIEQGVRFIILSPWQAEAICPIGGNKWQPLNNNPILSGRAYQIDRPHGSIAVFFYNHILATGISFQNFLQNADRLYEKLVSFKQNADPTYLVNIASDGEVYGHHEPFGDMCLAALIKLVKKNDDFKFLNYGMYLDLHPPTYLVKLRNGERGLGTSWSCVHGVARWYRNCGCTTGNKPDWNQEWRTPLRNALVYLRDKLRAIYIREMSLLSSNDPKEIRNSYIDVLTEKVNKNDFIKKCVDKTDPLNKKIIHRFFSLLEGQKYSMFMFTSCGWFFSEISGLETMQNMRYAIKASELHQMTNNQDILSPFLSELENARSNISTYGSGRNIVESIILKEKKGLQHGAAIFILSELCASKTYKNNTYGIFKRVDFSVEKPERNKTIIEKRGKVSIKDYMTQHSATFQFSLKEEELKGISLTLREDIPGDKHQKEIEISVGDLPIELRTYITSTVSSHVVDRCITESLESFNATRNALIYLKKMHVHRPKTIIELAELLIDRILEKSLNDPTVVPSETTLQRIKDLVIFTNEYELSVDIESLKQKISAIISYQANKLTNAIEEEPTRVIIHLLETCRQFGNEPEITKAQDRVFQLLRSIKNNSLKKIEEKKDFTALNRIRRLIKLGATLGFDVEKHKEYFFVIE
jgi:alpha-amylase/alpha-mannosidase (GH57 family)